MKREYLVLLVLFLLGFKRGDCLKKIEHTEVWEQGPAYTVLVVQYEKSSYRILKQNDKYTTAYYDQTVHLNYERTTCPKWAVTRLKKFPVKVSALSLDVQDLKRGDCLTTTKHGWVFDEGTDNYRYMLILQVGKRKYRVLTHKPNEKELRSKIRIESMRKSRLHATTWKIDCPEGTEELLKRYAEVI